MYGLPESESAYGWGPAATPAMERYHEMRYEAHRTPIEDKERGALSKLKDFLVVRRGVRLEGPSPLLIGILIPSVFVLLELFVFTPLFGPDSVLERSLACAAVLLVLNVTSVVCCWPHPVTVAKLLLLGVVLPPFEAVVMRDFCAGWDAVWAPVASVFYGSPVVIVWALATDVLRTPAFDSEADGKWPLFGSYKVDFLWRVVLFATAYAILHYHCLVACVYFGIIPGIPLEMVLVWKIALLEEATSITIFLILFLAEEQWLRTRGECDDAVAKALEAGVMDEFA